MLISKTAKVYIKMNNLEYYRNCGYEIETYFDKDKHERVKAGTYIDVKIKDLQDNSFSTVLVKCDYCGNIISKKYRDYIKQLNNSNIKKDACTNCKSYKVNDNYLIKYGTTSKQKLSKIQNYSIGRK